MSPAVGPILIISSEMTERFKVPVLKTGVVKATVGSNPTLAATSNV